MRRFLLVVDVQPKSGSILVRCCSSSDLEFELPLSVGAPASTVSDVGNLPWLGISPLHEWVTILISDPDMSVLKSDVEFPLLLTADNVGGVYLNHVLA